MLVPSNTWWAISSVVVGAILMIWPTLARWVVAMYLIAVGLLVLSQNLPGVS